MAVLIFVRISQWHQHNSEVVTIRKDSSSRKVNRFWHQDAAICSQLQVKDSTKVYVIEFMFFMVRSANDGACNDGIREVQGHGSVRGRERIQTLRDPGQSG